MTVTEYTNGLQDVLRAFYALGYSPDAARQAVEKRHWISNDSQFIEALQADVQKAQIKALRATGDRS